MSGPVVIVRLGKCLFWFSHRWTEYLIWEPHFMFLRHCGNCHKWQEGSVLFTAGPMYWVDCPSPPPHPEKLVERKAWEAANEEKRRNNYWGN